MGFYIRKAFKLGPVRLNLSKSGLGVSAGVKGARVGVSSRGQAYSHAGRFGLYHRQTYGSVSSGGSGRARASSTREVEVDTGVTYGSYSPSVASSQPRLEEHEPSGGLASKALMMGGVLVGLMGMASCVGSLGAGSGAAMVCSGVVLLAGGAAGGVGLLLRRRARRYAEQLQRLVQSSESAEQLEAGLRKLVRKGSARRADRAVAARGGYLQLLRRIVQDGVVSDEELRGLSAYESIFELDESFTSIARTQVFREVYLEAVADHHLDEPEQAALEGIRHRLQIPEAHVQDELRMMRDLASIREIWKGHLPEVQASVKLQRGESCHCESPARLLKHKNVGTVQQDGVRYKQMGFAADKDGTLLVTSKRVLFVHQGTSSVPHDKILDVDVDTDRSVITIIKDGRKTPIYYTVPHALRVGTTIAAAAGV